MGAGAVDAPGRPGEAGEAGDVGASGGPDHPPMISWEAARVVAGGVSRPDRLSPAQWRELEDDFAELTPLAESLVAEVTGLVPLDGPARAVVLDRAGWVAANTASFDRLLSPLLARLPVGAIAGFPGYGVLAAAGRVVAGVELGALLGWMAGRVLGQYDVVFGALGGEEGPAGGTGEVLFVGPNIVEMEHRFGFPPRQFRLWIALHELTHRAQFTGVAWMRPYFLSLVEEAVGRSMPGSFQVADTLRAAFGAVRARKASGDSELGLIGLFFDEEQREVFGRVQGLMSLLEGHGDVVMDRAAGERIPLASHFSSVLADRRARLSGLTRLVAGLIGLDAKMRQYAEGERFVAFVEEACGRELFDRVWERPENLPTAAEIKDPASWVERVGR